MSEFSDDEIKILETVFKKFGLMMANEISLISHEKDAWKDFMGKEECIDYNTAFKLKTVE